MPASLGSIVDAARERVSRQRKDADMRALEQAAASHVPRGFRKRLQQASSQEIAIIAELKKASPSKGVIRQEFDPPQLAKELEMAGAAALSVLTDKDFFQGSLENLRQASESTSLPCLRKDFIVDAFQIVEARANRADAVLLIVAALEEDELLMLLGAAQANGIDALCEVHTRDELDFALESGADLIGVNNRDLQTFEVRLETSLELADRLPKNSVRVAESGIHTADDLRRLRSVGYDAFLVGESLMRAKNAGNALRELRIPSR
jgi:indole-3-glycerol phosphate synthase